MKVATPVKGRHKIRKLIDDNQLKDKTKSAHRLEMERRKRIEEAQKKVVFDIYSFLPYLFIQVLYASHS